MPLTYIHIAKMIAIEKAQTAKVLYKEEAKNKYLATYSRKLAQICIPSDEIIDFKESLLMAYVVIALIRKNQ